MTNINKFIIVLVIAILIFVFQNKPDEKLPINKVSYNQGKGADQEVKVINKAKVPVVSEEKISPLDLDDIVLESKGSNQLSYLDIYKKYKRAINCSGINLDKLSEKGEDFYIDGFVREIKFLSNKRQKKVTDAQLRSYEDFVSQCWDLYLEMPNISDLTLQKIKSEPYIIRDTLRRLLQSTDGLTAEEIELKEVLIAGFDFSKIDNNLWELSRGTHTLDEQELRATYKEIDGKEAEIRKLALDNPHSYDVDQYDRLTLELQQVKDYIANSTMIDESELKSETLRFYKLAMEIFTHAQTPYATVFFEVFTTLNFTSHINGVLKPNHSFYIMQKYKSDYQSFSQKIYKDSGLTNDEYFNHVINPAIHLYLCHLGADCSANSIVMSKYCATNRQIYGQIRQDVYSEACGKSVSAFYSQDYLSANLANDVDLLLKYLVRKYAY